VVEDAAESLGSFTSGTHTGRIGQIGILSFNGNKIITTGGGGALLTDDKEIARRAKHLTTTAKQPHPWLFLHDEIGYNYRLPNINAALGCAQIEQLPTFVNKKRNLAHQYRNWFAERGQEFVSEPLGAASNYWLNSIVLSNVDERDKFLTFTNSRNVMTRAMWTPMHTLPMYRRCYRADLTNAEAIEKRLVNIPSSVV
jgi:dTDP-4-amino-4,6-dideoxygalactose transaminase